MATAPLVRLTVAVAALALGAAPAAAAAAPRRAEVVVELRGGAIASRVPLRALRGPDGRIDPSTLGARIALGRIAAEQTAVERRLRRRVGGLVVRARLRYALDALVVDVAARDVGRLDVRGVVRVLPAVRYRQTTDRVPTLIDAVPVWGTPPGAPGGSLGDGERIAIIDDGIDIRRPSFSGAGYAYPPGFPKGLRAGVDGKVIVARAFPPPGGTARMRTAFDPHGSEHGTHVAGIAAGASGITAVLRSGVVVPGLSGVAPRAYLGSYRVFTTPTPGFGLDGNGPEIAQAIDSAVADGMDVLNLSLGEPEVQLPHDVVAQAIAGAARAGVVTVVAAGNEADSVGGGSISSPGSAPAAITVGAVTNDRFFGVSLGLLAADAPPQLQRFGAATATAQSIPRSWQQGVPLVVASGCGGGGRPDALLLVALSARCDTGRAESAALGHVRGVLFAEPADGDPNAEGSATAPELTVTRLLGVRLAAAVRAAGGRALLSVGNVVGPQVSENGGLTTTFSSLGPSAIGLALKPDVSAPGQGVLSPVPGGYAIWDGTSMATPAVAGAVALLRERHPQWTPAQIKSSLALTARPVYRDDARRHQAGPLAAGSGMVDVAAADDPGVFAGPSAADFALVRPGSAVTVTIELRDAGDGAGTWSVAAHGLTAPADVVVPAGGGAALPLTLRVPANAPQGNRQGFVVLQGPRRAVRIRWWGFVDRPALRAERVRTLAVGWSSGDTRLGVSRVSRYRWPDDPRGSGLPLRYGGREQLFRFHVGVGAMNAGVRTVGAVVPQILLAPDESRLAGPTALPLDTNPYQAGYGRPEPVSALLLPEPGTYWVVVETRPGARPGPFRVRLWIDDRTPPAAAIENPVVAPGTPLRVDVTDAGSGVSFADLALRVDGRTRGFRVVDGAVRVETAGLRPGRHLLELRASDWQETKNSENASALGLPNTRLVVRAFRVARG